MYGVDLILVKIESIPKVAKHHISVICVLMRCLKRVIGHMGYFSSRSIVKLTLKPGVNYEHNG